MIADPDIVRTVLTMFWLLAEPVRLWAGYYGNLQENVPWLVIFAALTMARGGGGRGFRDTRWHQVQCGVCRTHNTHAHSPTLSLAFKRTQYLTPFDKALSVVTALVLHIEFVVALYAVRGCWLAVLVGCCGCCCWTERDRWSKLACSAVGLNVGPCLITLSLLNPIPPGTQIVRMLRMQRRQYYLFEAALQQQQAKQQWQQQQRLAG